MVHCRGNAPPFPHSLVTEPKSQPRQYGDKDMMIDSYLRSAVLCALLCLTLWAEPRSAMAGANPFLGEIETFAFNFCPTGWAALNGQLLPISQNQALFALLGTTYGGDGQTTFAVPTAKPIFSANGAPLKQCIAMQGIFPSRN
jgi:Phage Tail Collar Domain